MSHVVLGLSDDYTANVALLVDGEPVFAAANERFTRRKGDAGFPAEALSAALNHAGIGLQDVDEVVVANRTHFVYRLLRAQFQGYTHDFFGLDQKAYLEFHDLVHASRAMRWSLHAFNARLLGSRLGRPVRLCDHHLAHACCAVASADFDSCLVVTVDNLGDGCAAKVHSWSGGRMKLLQASPAQASPGQFYGEITQLLGYNPLRHAGKITGLAGYGEPGPAYGIMERLFGLSADGRVFRLAPSWARWPRRGLYRELSLFSPEDVAAAAQQRLEDVVGDWVRGALERSGQQRLALAGGVTANVRLNRVLADLPGVRAVHVHPAMSDEGLALGAAASALLSGRRLRSRRMASVYLGPDHGQAELDSALADVGLPSVAPEALAPTVARLLAAGHVLARFDGRLEYGPRALGNRSILYRPDDPSVKDWLNERLHRTEFMPFAPVTAWEDAERCYEGLEGRREAARFMTIALDCTPEMKRLCPGVVHVDGTARPQLLRREENPGFYDILAAFRRITGLPALINTSFNMHEEPIVASPQDATAAFLASGLDFLVFGRCIAWDPRRPQLEQVLLDARSRDQ